ncbi:cutinase-domain-containing protein [Mycena rosella]|uniref:Cutinase-domain-containing protein n=1 Tax=Mycena rosella TaxID=1033263 RepID=A0AAD7FU46_MYCRO|nr:cutinase-domain-containing protein [Mycena rosella]
MAIPCSGVHVFGARETTAPPGFGTVASVVSSITSWFSGSTEVINYPACGGQPSCGDVSYASSAIQDVAAVANQVNAFNSQYSNTVLVLVGLTSTAIPISTAAQKKIATAIFMGDPFHIPGLSYNFAPRPAGFQCPFASNIQSYCDAADPFCCNGDDPATHQGYGVEYGAVALTFVNKVNVMLNGSGGGTTTAGSPPSSPTGGTVAEFGQCGGQGWTGGSVCQTSFTCQVANAFFSQCL